MLFILYFLGAILSCDTLYDKQLVTHYQFEYLVNDLYVLYYNDKLTICVDGKTYLNNTNYEFVICHDSNGYNVTIK